MFHMLKQHLGEQTTSNMFQHLGLLKTTCGTTFRAARGVHVCTATHISGFGVIPLCAGLCSCTILREQG